MPGKQTNSIEQLVFDSGAACAYAHICQQASKIPLKIASDFVSYIQKLVEDDTIQTKLNAFNTESPQLLANQFIQIINDNTPNTFNSIKNSLNKRALVKKIEEHLNAKQTLDIAQLFRKIWESESLQTGLLTELKKIDKLHKYWDTQLKQTENLFDIDPAQLIDYFSNISLSNIFSSTQFSITESIYNTAYRATSGKTRTKLHICYLDNKLIERFNHSTTFMVVSQSRDFAIIIELHKQVILFWDTLVKHVLDPLANKQAHKVNLNLAHINRVRSTTKEAIIKLKNQTHTHDIKILIEQVTLMLAHDERKLSQHTPLPETIAVTTFKPADARHFLTLQTTMSHYRPGSISEPDRIRMRYLSRLFTPTPPEASKKTPSPEPATPVGRTYSASFCF